MEANSGVTLSDGDPVESHIVELKSDSVTVYNMPQVGPISSTMNAPLLRTQWLKKDETTSFRDSNPQALKGRPVQGCTLNKGEGPTIGYMISALPSLATFSIIGVMIRFGLEILFGPQVAVITARNSSLFIDLPANMVGCFFMGWVGSVLKPEITKFSELLAIGLSTGLMGSITTFASWNQSMIGNITDGYLIQSFCALLLGMELAQMSYVVGMDSAKLVKWMANHGHLNACWRGNDLEGRQRSYGNKVQSFFVLLSSTLWIWAAVLATLDVHPTRRRLWIGCAVGPLGTWARWFLSLLNGRGIGPRRRLKWFPLGTFLTNFMASLVESGMALYQCIAPDPMMKLLMGSFQLGFLGCMSTVSTMISEAYNLRKARKPWRAYAYIFISLVSSMALSLPIYSSPIWLFKTKRNPFLVSSLSSSNSTLLP